MTQQPPPLFKARKTSCFNGHGWFHKQTSKAFAPAFSATLEEVANSDLIIHLIDSTDKNLETHIDVVLGELEKLGATKIPRLTVFNKIDVFNNGPKRELREKFPDAILISAKKEKMLKKLRTKF